MMKASIGALTSLRFFAALLVFLDHYVIGLFTPVLTWRTALAYIGITFFFTLSGFVLSYAYQETFLSKSMSIIKFYIGRVARIWPMHMLCLLLMLPLVGSMFVHDFSHMIFNFLVNVLLLQDFVPHAAEWFNGPSWSISAEMFFYLCFPFLVVLSGRWPKFFQALLLSFFILLIIAGVILSWRFTNLGQHNLALSVSFNGIFYVFPPLRLFDFMLGIFLYQIYKKICVRSMSQNWATAFEGMAWGLLLLTYLLHVEFPVLLQFDVIYCPAIFLLLLIFALERGFFASCLRQPKLILLGEASFAFYMLQEPLNRILLQVLPGLNPFIFQMIHFIILVLVASLLHKHFELPCYLGIRKYFDVKRQVKLRHYLE